MGTNYYWRETENEYCGECGRPMPWLHIGKSSAGWNFSLRIHPNEGINNLENWKERWEKGSIWDEYGREVTVEDMLETITERSHPNGLCSHVGLRGPYWADQAAYGGPTWDLCNYEFS